MPHIILKIVNYLGSNTKTWCCYLATKKGKFDKRKVKFNRESELDGNYYNNAQTGLNFLSLARAQCWRKPTSQTH